MRATAERFVSVRRTVVASALALVACMAMPQVAEACAVCYGDVEAGLTQGMNNGILALLAIVGVVQVGFVALFLRIRQRGRQARQQRDRFQVIEGGTG